MQISWLCCILKSAYQMYIIIPFLHQSYLPTASIFHISKTKKCNSKATTTIIHRIFKRKMPISNQLIVRELHINPITMWFFFFFIIFFLLFLHLVSFYSMCFFFLLSSFSLQSPEHNLLPQHNSFVFFFIIMIIILSLKIVLVAF